MKTTKEMIEVMQAFDDGTTIEFSNDNNGWLVATETPGWNWRFSDYRIKQPYHQSVPAILKKLIDEKQTIVFSPSDNEQNEAIQELIFELGIRWVSNGSRVQECLGRMSIGGFHAGYALYASVKKINFNLDTGEYTPVVVEMTMAEINEHFGKNVKIVK